MRGLRLVYDAPGKLPIRGGLLGLLGLLGRLGCATGRGYPGRQGGKGAWAAG